MCGNIFKDKGNLNIHMEKKHGSNVVEMKSILKDGKITADKAKKTQILKDIVGENCLDKVITDCNTLINRSSSESEKKVIQTLKNLAELSQKTSCENCTKTAKSAAKIDDHIQHKYKKYHEERSCCETAKNGSNFGDHTRCNHDGSASCGFCEKTTETINKIDDHIGDKHDQNQVTSQIFLSHHNEKMDNDEAVELDPLIWNILFSNGNDKELTDAEQKEILKLHRYFAHRGGQKLWENLFLPAGRYTGKKKLVLKFLEKCEICKRHKRSPNKPKVGLPKS